MDKATSSTLVKLHAEMVAKHSVNDWGITFVDGRWVVGFLVGYKRYVGAGETPQEAYVRASHDIAGTEPPPF
jgi:hypothetical protein